MNKLILTAAVPVLLASLALLTSCNNANSPGELTHVQSIELPATQMAIVQTGLGGAEVLKYQSIPGSDLAGIVVSLGDGVSDMIMSASVQVKEFLSTVSVEELVLPPRKTSITTLAQQVKWC